MTLPPDEIRKRILQELYRQTRGASRPVDFIALARRIGVAWPEATTEVIALRREGLIHQLELKWSISLTPEGCRRCEAEVSPPQSDAPAGAADQQEAASSR